MSGMSSAGETTLQGVGFARLVAVCLLATASAWADPPATRIEVVADRSAVVPGGTLEVAFQFHIPDHWHIYWQNSGDSGMPPKVVWKLPPGFSTGPLRHPPPQRHVDPRGDLVTFIHEGTPVLIATVTAPGDLQPGTSVDLHGELRGLVCRERCIPLSRPFSLTLPVAAADLGPGKQAELFASAHAALPKPAEQAEYLRITPSVSSRPIGPKSKFTLTVALEVQPGYHIQSHTPLSPDLIATDVFLEATEGIFFERGRFPAHTVRTVRKMKVAEYAGTVEVTFEGEADNTLPPGPLTFGGVVTYQACDALGRCFAPQHVTWSMDVPTTASPGPPPAGAAPPNAPAVPAAPAPAVGPQGSLLWYLFAAVVGGLILNVMPCVLPVVSIKVLSFVQQAGEERRRVLHLGLAFCGGIMVSFGVLAGVVIVLQQAGQSVGWGFQLSNPVVVVVMTSIIFVFGLSLFGVFEFNLPGRASARLGAQEAREGLEGSFMKGVLATVLATPCTAPFLGSAVGYALQQPPHIIMLMMLAVGAGMALPYLLLTAQPAWMRFLPRPGPWMEHFKQFMGFVLMGTVVWLLRILADLMDASGLVWTLAFLCFLALACWLIGMVGPTMSPSRQVLQWGGAMAVIAAGAVLSFSAPSAAGVVPWEPWQRNIGPQLASEGYTVYLDYTATWCATCQTNKKFVLERGAVQKQFRELGVRPIKADWTRQPQDMTDELLRFDRKGVPLNLVFPANRPAEVIVLPEILTTDIVLDALRRAGPSAPDSLARR